jgi:hypothetical protein
VEMSQLIKILSDMQDAASECVLKIEGSLKKKRPISKDTKKLIRSKERDLAFTKKARDNDIPATKKYFKDKNFPDNKENSDNALEFLRQIEISDYNKFLEMAREKHPVPKDVILKH